jgi:hypothetical protein
MLGTVLLALGIGCFEQREPVDVFLISVDTLRLDHVSAFNSDSPAQTPHMAALAQDGVRFTQAFSPVSVTGPAFCSAMTGLEPGRHGVLTNLFRGGKALGDEHITLAERFKAAGHKTGAFVSAFTLRQQLGLRQGFDIYNGGENSNRDGDLTASVMVPWVRHEPGPIFAWFHSFDPHGPYHRMMATSEYDNPWVETPADLAHIPEYQRIHGITDPKLYESLYARGVERADKAVGILVAGLKATGRYDDALIVLFADHGEGFQERALWYDHGNSAHAEQTHVPLIIKYPKGKGAGTEDKRLVSLLDLAPTALAVAGLPPLDGIDGRSLLGADPVHTTVVSESSHCKAIDVLACSPSGGQAKEIAVRSLQYVLVSAMEAGVEVERVYDRVGDPSESHPQSQSAPPVLIKAMKPVREDRRGRTYAALPKPDGTNDEDEKLRALGYTE